MCERNLNCSWKLLNSDGSPSTIFLLRETEKRDFSESVKRREKMQTIAENEDSLAAEKGAKGYRQVVELYHDEPDDDSYLMTIIVGV